MIYKDGLLISYYGTKRYYKNNAPHRLTGPAVINDFNSEWWYYKGRLVKCETQEEYQRYIKLLILL